MDVEQAFQWQDANINYLMASAQIIYQIVLNHIGDPVDCRHSPVVKELALEREVTAKSLPLPSALQDLVNEFNLSGFEEDILLLCVTMETHSNFGLVCAEAQKNPQLNYPTFTLAMSALATPHWNALAPNRPIRRWRLIEVLPGKTLTLSPLRINERILHYLMGVDCLDEELKGIIEPVNISEDNCVRSHASIATEIAEIWRTPKQRYASVPIVVLCGDEIAGKGAIAKNACTMSGLKLVTMSALKIPTATDELNNLILLWEREARLSGKVLWLDCDRLESFDPSKENAIAQFITTISSPVIITSREPHKSITRHLITFDVHRPTKAEQLIVWREALGSAVPISDEAIEALGDGFNLSAPTIYTVCTEVLGRIAGKQKIEKGEENKEFYSRFGEVAPLLWDTCRAQCRPRLDDLAQRIKTAATWEDLILPSGQIKTLKEIIAHVRQRSKVYSQWGFASKGGRGLGISVLLAGTSGTGKTMSSEVIAQELQLDLYRVDLSSVVSKYIGETEKNLRRVFDAAEGGTTILLFDEADALFGKRSAVKDSRDRYANQEVSYLLQRMESFQGLAILTTNLKDSIDSAFLRRIRFLVNYPFPDFKNRSLIWQKIFPKDTPTEGLSFNRLAQLNIAGGNIRNIALNATFLAADAGEPVMMKHLLAATISEYTKLDKILADGEIKGWS